jgi:hypothetical protein
MFETSKGPEVATHQRLLTFGRDFASRSIFETEISCPGRPLLHTHKGVVGEGALHYIHLVLVLLVGCAAEYVGRS